MHFSEQRCEFWLKVGAISMASIDGRIVIVQEDRFLLETDDGHHRLFILPHATALKPEDLRALERDGRQITVQFGKPEHLIAAVAEQITVTDAASRQRKPGRGLVDAIAGFARDWSLPRQLLGQSPRSQAAASSESRALKPRLMDADRVGTNICAYCAVGCAQLIYAK